MSSTFNLKAIFSLVDRMTAPAKKVADSMKGIEQATTKVGGAGKVTSAITDRMSKAFGKAKEMGATFATRIGNAKKALDQYTGSAKSAEKSTKMLSGLMGKVTGLLAGVSAVAIVKGFLDTSSMFEGYQATLETVLGSVPKAKEAMAWVQNFAKETPYELAEVTDAFVKLNAYGIDATNGSLKILGDGASGMHKTLDQAVEALADAQTFQFERLKEFGITSIQKGNEVFLTYTKNNKQYAVQATKSASAVRKAVLDIFSTRFAGAMEKQSKTFSGVMSNIKDAWTGFQKQVGDAGFFDAVKTRLESFLSRINAMSKNGQLQVWAKKVSDALVKLFDAFVELAESVDWIGLINGIAGFVSWLAKFIDKMGGLKNIVDIGIAAWLASFVFGLNALTPAIVAVAAALFGLELAAWPITLVIGLIAALAAGAFLVWRNWDKIGPFFAHLWDGIVKGALKVWDNIVDFFTKGPQRLWNAMPNWLKAGILGGLSVAVPGGALVAGALAPTLAKPAPSAFANRQGMKGQLDINIKSDQPTTVTGLKSNTDSFGFNVKNGYQGVMP